MANWLGSLRDRETALWQAGNIDDRMFENMQVRRTRLMVGLVFAVLLVVVVAAVIAGRLSEQQPIAIEQLLLVAGIWTLFGFAMALRVGRWVKVGARNKVLARHRARAEANPAQGLPSAARGGTAASATPARYFGSYKRSLRYARKVIGLASVVVGISGGFSYWRDSNGYEIHPILVMFGATGAALVAWGLYMVADRRVFLTLSAAGIGCRAWGKEQHAFADFKAVYARQSGIKRGIVFVPRNPEAFRRKLSWAARLMFRGGGGVQAHARTMTLWTTEVDLPRDAVLREVQAEIVRALGSVV